MQRFETAITVRERPVTWSGSRVGIVADVRNHIAQGVNVLTQFVGEKTLPRSLSQLSAIPTLLNEVVLNPSEATPGLFWTMVVDKVKNVHTGAGQRKDLTPAVETWFDIVTEKFKDNKVDALSADFIYTGMSTILAQFQIPQKNRALTEEMRKTLGKLYQKLVTSDNLQGGWKQIHADLVGTLRTSKVDTLQVNPKIDSEHTGTDIVHKLVEDLTDKKVGLGSEFDKYLRTDSGEHIFTVEWRNFTESEQLKEESVDTKVKLMTELRHEIPTAFKGAKDPGQKSALQMAYVEASSQIVDSDYTAYRTNVMVQAEKAIGKVKPADAVMEGVEAELSPLLDILADPYSGIDGLKVTKIDSIKTIADAVKQQYEELWTAIEEGGSLELKGVFIEVARKKVLEALKKSKYGEFVELYQELVKDPDPQGVKKMYARKYSQLEVPEAKAEAKLVLEEVAKEGISELLQKITDDTYGIQEEFDLTPAFMDELNQLITAVSDFNPQLGTAFAHAADQLLDEMRTTTKQKAEGIAKVYNKIQEGFRDVKAIDTVVDLCVDPTIPQPLKNASQDEVIRYQNAELQPARDFWNGVLPVVVDKDYGATGSQADISPSVVDYIKQVAEELKSKSPEYQRRFIKAGIEAIVPTIGDVSAQRGAGAKLVELFHDVLMSDTLVAGRQHMYEYWMYDTYQLEQVIELTFHPSVGQGAKFNIVNDVYSLLDGFIANARGTGQHEDSTDQRAYLTFNAIEEKVKKAIRSTKNTTVQHALANLYKSSSDSLGEAAMRHLAQGDLMAKAKNAVEGVAAQSTFDATREAELKAVIQVWDAVWDNYYDIAYGNGTLQGAPGSMLNTLKANMRHFEDALSNADELYTVAYLESGVKKAFEYLKKAKGVNFDTRQRVAFDTLRLLGHSQSKLVQELAKRENPSSDDEPRGAKRVRTLGGVQTRFIKAAIQDPELMKSFTQYIETKPAPGQRKDGGELKLCMELLMTARDYHMMRQVENGVMHTDDVTGLEVGKSPSLQSLTKMENALIASLESLTNNLKGDTPEMNAVFELLSAFGMFSPQTLTRLSYATDELRDLKNIRKGSKKVMEGMHHIESLGLAPDEEYYQMWRTLGKEQFNLENATEFSPALRKMISEAVKVDGENLITLVQTFRGDVCRVVDQPPGLQYFFGRDWDNPKAVVPRLRNIFERYMTGFARRFELLESGEIKTEQAKKVVATELLAVSMMFEQFAGDLTEVKKGPHKKFFKILRGILLDREKHGAERKYNDDVHNVADHILKFSLPHWNEELVKDFFNDMYNHANNNEFSTWIEQGRWKELCDAMAILPQDHTPTFMDERSGLDGLTRVAVAKHAVDATLNILRSYTFLSGPRNVRLAYDIVTGTRTQGIDTIDIKVAPKDMNFIFQAINNVTWYGTEEQKMELIKILEDLGRQDALMLVQTGSMRPPQAQTRFIEHSMSIARSISESAKTIYSDYVVALSAVATGIKPVLKVTKDGSIDVSALPTEYAGLRTFIEARGQQVMKDAVHESGYDKVQKKAQEAASKLTLEKIRNMGGVELIETITDHVIAQTGGAGIYQEVLKTLSTLLEQVKLSDVVTTQSSAPSANPISDIDVKISKSASQVGALFGMLREQGTTTVAAASEILESVSGLREALMKVAQEMAVQSGATDTSRVAEELSQVLIKQISAVIVDESAAQRLIGSMRTKFAEIATAEYSTWLYLEKKITENSGSIKDIQVDELYERAKAELAELREKRTTHVSERMKIIQAMNVSVSRAAGAASKAITQAKDIDRDEYAQLLTWLEKVYGAGEVKESESIGRRMSTYAEFCNTHIGFPMRAGIKMGAVHMARQRVKRENMVWTPQKYLRALGFKVIKNKVVPMTSKDLKEIEPAEELN